MLQRSVKLTGGTESGDGSLWVHHYERHLDLTRHLIYC